MSRHHEKAITNVIKKEIKIKYLFILFIKTKPLNTRHRAPLEAKMGQGLMFTKWKGLNFFVIT